MKAKGLVSNFSHSNVWGIQVKILTHLNSFFLNRFYIDFRMCVYTVMNDSQLRMKRTHPIKALEKSILANNLTSIYL